MIINIFWVQWCFVLFCGFGLLFGVFCSWCFGVGFFKGFELLCLRFVILRHKDT